MACVRKRPRNIKPQPTATTPCLSRPTCCNKILLRMCLTQSGCRTSPIFGRKKAGYIWRWCLSFIPAGQLVGLSASVWPPLWCNGIVASSHTEGGIVHSDQGIASIVLPFIGNFLSNINLACSMSKKGDCYDNAAMKSWNHGLRSKRFMANGF